eukprot:1361962-Rhodomonas_salina.1
MNSPASFNFKPASCLNWEGMRAEHHKGRIRKRELYHGNRGPSYRNASHAARFKLRWEVRRRP